MVSALSSVYNILLLLPPSVGSGGERRLSWTAFLHEQNLGEDPEKEERHKVEQEIEKSWKVGEGKRLKIIYQSLAQAHVAISILPNVIKSVHKLQYTIKGKTVEKQGLYLLMLIIYGLDSGIYSHSEIFSFSLFQWCTKSHQVLVNIFWDIVNIYSRSHTTQ